MNRRNLTTLLMIAAVLIAGVLMVDNLRQTAVENQLFLPVLEDQLNEITSVRIVGPGNKPIATLTRDTDSWSIDEKFGYPAAITRIRSNLIALSRAQVVEKKTANPEFHERLGVDDISNESAGGILVEIDGLNEPVAAIIGESGVSGGNFAYARKPGEDQSWLISGSFDLGSEAGDWMNKDIVDISPDRIRAVSITHPDGKTLMINKSSSTDADYLLVDLPEDRELRYPGITNSIAGVLAKLNLEDVRPAADINAREFPRTQVRYETFDGLQVDLSVISADDGEWILISAGTESEAGFAYTEAASLNARTSGWAYAVPGYKSEQLLKRPDDLLAPENPD